jgi:hypothetical protein
MVPDNDYERPLDRAEHVALVLVSLAGLGDYDVSSYVNTATPRLRMAGPLMTDGSDMDVEMGLIRNCKKAQGPPRRDTPPDGCTTLGSRSGEDAKGSVLRVPEAARPIARKARLYSSNLSLWTQQTRPPFGLP